MNNKSKLYLLSLALASASALAQTNEPATDPSTAEPTAPAATDTVETTVVARKPVSAASTSVVRNQDFLLRPHPRPADITQVTPGLFVGQHAGGGKANQYFLRGFDVDHGTDIDFQVDGVPQNLVSHGHGQGYTDLHWMIPELVERIQVHKGPYLAEQGDFATAGSVHMQTKDSVARNQVTVSGGTLGAARVLGIFGHEPEEDDAWKPIVAVEAYRYDGPFDAPEKTARVNLNSKFTKELPGAGKLAVGVTSYTGSWNSSGQIPLREVAADRLDRFGSIDPSEGGQSSRHSVYGHYTSRPDARSELTASAYMVNYRLGLYSNFTFFSADPVNGDQINQEDARTILGAKMSYRFLRDVGSIRLETTVGAQSRHDKIDNSLRHTRARERIETVAGSGTDAFVDTRIGESSLAIYAQEDVTWTPWLRTVIGARVDHFTFQVDDRLEGATLATTGDATSGVRNAHQVSPKASLILSPLRQVDLFVNYGKGFHSNDARGVVRAIDSATPLTAAEGYEIGAKARLGDEVELGIDYFLINLENETTWVGDAGVNEVGGPTRRQGVEATARYRPLPWLLIDGDVSATRGRLTGSDVVAGEDRIPLAPTLTAQAGVTAFTEGGVFGRIGVFAITERPATEDNFLKAEGFTRFDASVGYRLGDFEASLAIQNLTNTKWREAQFATVSRLPNETSDASCPSGTRGVTEDGTFLGCEDVHFTPGVPFSVLASVSYFF